MTMKKVRQLWWSQTRGWVIGLSLLMMLIGLVLAVQTTQQKMALSVESKTERAQQVKDHQKNPENYLIHGNRVSLKAYRNYQHQFFYADEFKTHGYETTNNRSNIWFYGVMMLIGLVLAFWGRRTHYYEFLLGLGVTRLQLWCVQVLQVLKFGIVMGATQFIYWGWIIAIIPTKWQRYRNLSGLFGHSVAITIIGLSILMLSWLIGQTTTHFWLAGLLSFLTWRTINGAVTNSGYTSSILGDGFAPESWFNAHYYVSASLAGFVTIILLVLTWLSFRCWSGLTRSKINQGIFLVAVVLGFGTLLGDTLLQPFVYNSGSITPWYEIVGMALMFIVGSFGLWWQRRREVYHAA